VYLEFTYRLPRFFTITLLAAQAVLVEFSPSNYIFFGEHVLFACETAVAQVGRKSLALGVLTAIAVAHGVFLMEETKIKDSSRGVKDELIMFMAITGILVALFRGVGQFGTSASLAMLWDGL